MVPANLLCKGESKVPNQYTKKAALAKNKKTKKVKTIATAKNKKAPVKGKARAAGAR